MTAGPLMALDSAGLWFRAFHSVPEKVTGPAGQPVNAIRGFLDMTAVLIGRYGPSGVIAAMDQDWRPQWRVDLVSEYKAQRVADDGAEDAPDALAPQVDTICALLDAAGVCRVGAPEAEADDALAYLAARGDRRKLLIVTGDRDLFQLAASRVEVVYIGAGMKKQQAYGPEAVAERFGLPVSPDARLYADYAVLVGDASDGLPGVAGIGAKTAATLLDRFGNLESLLDAVDDPAASLTPRQRTALAGSAEYVRAAARIVRLGSPRLDATFSGAQDGRVGEGNPAEWSRLVAEYGLGSVAERFMAALGTLDRL